jgi:hypothetical protein
MSSLEHIAVASDFWSQSIVTGSGWVFTISGTAIAGITLYQVRSKNSAFRRALVIVTRRRTNQDLRDLLRQLKRMSGKVSEAALTAVPKLAIEWTEVAWQALAAFEASSVSDPLAPGATTPDRWTTEEGKSIFAAIRKAGGASRAEEVLGTESPALSLRGLLNESCKTASTCIADPSDQGHRDLQRSIAEVVGRMAYVCKRLGYSEIGDFHDDR